MRSPGFIDWNISGFCLNPHYRELYGYRPPYGVPRGAGSRRVEWEPGKAGPLSVGLWCPCRACGPCLKSRRNLWTMRSATEIRSSPRTWMCTYTLRPEEHYRALCAGSLRYPDEPDSFIVRHRIISQEFTRYFKRVRWESGAKLQYILVCEAHQSGLPHYHALVHEVTEFQPVRKEILRAQWTLGFSRFKLVEVESKSIRKSARYAAKYLAKDTRARVRASRGYGNIDLQSKRFVLETACNHDPNPQQSVGLNNGLACIHSSGRQILLSRSVSIEEQGQFALGMV